MNSLHYLKVNFQSLVFSVNDEEVKNSIKKNNYYFLTTYL